MNVHPIMPQLCCGKENRANFKGYVINNRYYETDIINRTEELCREKGKIKIPDIKTIKSFLRMENVENTMEDTDSVVPSFFRFSGKVLSGTAALVAGKLAINDERYENIAHMIQDCAKDMSVEEENSKINNMKNQITDLLNNKKK